MLLLAVMIQHQHAHALTLVPFPPNNSTELYLTYIALLAVVLCQFAATIWPYLVREPSQIWTCQKPHSKTIAGKGLH